MVQTAAEQAKLSLGTAGDDAAKAALQKQIDDWQKTAARYRSEPETGEGTEQLAERAKHAEHERDEATAKYHHFELASAAFQIGIVLASATIITGMIALAWVSRPADARRHRHHRARPLRAASAASARVTGRVDALPVMPSEGAGIQYAATSRSSIRPLE